MEIFNGSARLAEAFADAGVPSWAYDVKYGPDCDLLNETVFKRLRQQIGGKEYTIIHFGLPCNTWSRAAQGTRPSGPLRPRDATVSGRLEILQADFDVWVGQIAFANVLELEAMWDNREVWNQRLAALPPVPPPQVVPEPEPTPPIDVMLPVKGAGKGDPPPPAPAPTERGRPTGSGAPSNASTIPY